MIARLSQLARRLPPRWWFAYGVYAVVFIGASALWWPGALPFTVVWVIVSVAVAVASDHPTPGRRRSKDPGTKHPAE